MMRSLEQINTIEFVKEGDIHDQIEGIQNSIAQGRPHLFTQQSL